MSETPAAAAAQAASEASAPAPAEAIPELLELGRRLRRAREGRGIGVAELADRLHLAPEQLTALESGDRSHLHEPVFVIAQAKRVAQALGVDVSQQVESLRHSRLMQPAAAATPSSAAPSAPGAPAAAAPRAAAEAAPARDGTASPPAGRGGRWSLAAGIAALTLLLGVLAAQAIRLWSQPRDATAPTAAGGAAGTATRPGASTAATGGAAPGVLLLRSDEPSWVEVRDGNGQVLFSGLLEKEARFRLGEGLRVLAGRPDLVTAAVGAEAPRRLGAISEVGWQDFGAAPSPSGTAPTAPAPAPAP